MTGVIVWDYVERHSYVTYDIFSLTFLFFSVLRYIWCCIKFSIHMTYSNWYKHPVYYAHNISVLWLVSIKTMRFRFLYVERILFLLPNLLDLTRAFFTCWLIFKLWNITTPHDICLELSSLGCIVSQFHLYQNIGARHELVMHTEQALLRTWSLSLIDDLGLIGLALLGRR